MWCGTLNWVVWYFVIFIVLFKSQVYLRNYSSFLQVIFLLACTIGIFEEGCATLKRVFCYFEEGVCYFEEGVVLL